MKQISNGMVFDTETATLIAEVKTKDCGKGAIYRTEKGNFFEFSSEMEGEDDSINFIKDGVSGVDEILIEWVSEFGDESVTIQWDKFEIG